MIVQEIERMSHILKKNYLKNIQNSSFLCKKNFHVHSKSIPKSTLIFRLQAILCLFYENRIIKIENSLSDLIFNIFQRISNAQLQTELVDILKNMFLPSKKMIKEQIEWLIEHKYMKRDEDNINMFIYMA